MHIWSTSALAAINPDRPGAAGTRLHGRWLILAWVSWAALVVLMLSVFVDSIPVYIAKLQTMGVSATTCTSQHLTLDPAQALRDLGLSVGSYAVFSVTLIVASALGWFAVGGVIVWHKSADWMALLVAMMLVTEGVVGISCLPGPLEKSALAWRLPLHFLYFLGPVLFLLVFSLFPNGQFVPRWTRWMVVALSAAYVPPAFFPDLAFSGLFSKLFVLGVSTFLVVAQLYRYRRVSTPMQRQQTRWVVFAVTLGLVVFIGWYLPTMIFTSLSLPGSGSSLAGHPAFTLFILLVPLGSPIFAFFTLLVPISLGIAILRYRLWDIDIIINRTLVYGTLTALLSVLYVGLVIGLQALVRLFTQQVSQSPVVIVASTLVVASLFQPLRYRIHSIVDRRFYRRKYNAARTLAQFSASLRNEVDLQQLREELLAVVQETMQPAHVSLWLRPVNPRERTELQPVLGREHSVDQLDV